MQGEKLYTRIFYKKLEPAGDRRGKNFPSYRTLSISLSAEEAFSSIVDSLVQKHLSGGKRPKSSPVEEHIQYMHRFALVGSLASLP